MMRFKPDDTLTRRDPSTGEIVVLIRVPRRIRARAGLPDFINADALPDGCALVNGMIEVVL